MKRRPRGGDRAWHPVAVTVVREAPRVSLRLAFSLGATEEPHAGLAVLTSQLLEEGTRRRSGLECARQLEGWGGLASSWCHYDAFGLSVEIPLERLGGAVDWLEEALLEPGFPPPALGRVARRIDSEVCSESAEPSWIVRDSLLREVFGEERRGKPLAGDPGDALRIDREEVVAFHRKACGRGLLISMAGPPGIERWVRTLEQRFPLARGPGRRARTRLRSVRPVRKRQIFPLAHAELAHLALGARSVDLRDPRRPALELLGLVLGSGGQMTGRLPLLLRERKGLAYAVSVELFARAGRDAGAALVEVECAPSQVGEVEKIVRRELEALCGVGPSLGEVERARSTWFGWRTLAGETAAQRADRALERLLLGISAEDDEEELERARAASARELSRLAQRLFDPAALRVRVGLPAAARGLRRRPPRPGGRRRCAR